MTKNRPRDPLSELKQMLCDFRDERDWAQFHTPKNLATALMVEAGELAEHFQWLTPEESDDLPQERLKKVGQEMADVFAYLILLSDRLNLDLVDICKSKLEVNRFHYPVEKFRGSSKKYDEQN